MSEDHPTFKSIHGGKTRSEEGEDDSEATLGLALMKSFLRLDREQKLQVIQFVNELASSPRPNED